MICEDNKDPPIEEVFFLKCRVKIVELIISVFEAYFFAFSVGSRIWFVGRDGL
jgi:hypothetical protein